MTLADFDYLVYVIFFPAETQYSMIFQLFRYERFYDFFLLVEKTGLHDIQ